MKNWLQSLMKTAHKTAFPLLAFPGATLIREPITKIVYDSTLQSQAIKAISMRVPTPASIGLIDMSLEAECFGCPVRMIGNEVPMVAQRIIRSRQEALDLAVPDIGGGRTGIAIDSIGKAANMIRDRPLFACCIGPYSLAGRLMDVSEMLLGCYDQPKIVHTVLEKATEFLIRYVQAFRAAGANGVLLAEPLTGLLSPDLARTFSEPYVRQICRSVQNEQFLFLYHNCGGSVTAILPSILAIGADAYHFGNAVSMERVLRAVPPDTPVLGNLDPVKVFLQGSTETVRAETTDLLALCRRYNNYIVSTGCDMPLATPWENIDAMFSAVESYPTKTIGPC